MSKYILQFDIGTSSAKTVLFDTNFNIIAHASKDYDTKHPQLDGLNKIRKLVASINR